MAVLRLKIVDAEGTVLCQSEGNDFVDLVYKQAYRDGDRILLTSEKVPALLNIQLDDAVGRGTVYLTQEFAYEIPFGEKKANKSPKAFEGTVHYLFAEDVTELETGIYRNLSCNPYDVSGEAVCFPHASANIETRNETVFAARNAIDGIRANLFHGEWPYTSWGINRRDDAELKLEFGRKVAVNKILIYTRADFPHDNWWEQISVSFSDGSEIIRALEKSRYAHIITFEEKEIAWLTLHDLIKADDPSPFPALTQIEVYGKEVTQ